MFLAVPHKNVLLLLITLISLTTQSSEHRKISFFNDSLSSMPSQHSLPSVFGKLLYQEFRQYMSELKIIAKNQRSFGKGYSQEYLEILNAMRFNTISNDQVITSKERVLTVLLILNRLVQIHQIPSFPENVKLHILSRLPLQELVPHKALCRKLFCFEDNPLYPILFKQVHLQVGVLLQQLKLADTQKSKLELQASLHKEFDEEAWDLCSKNKLEEDLEAFDVMFPDVKKLSNDNLALSVYRHCLAELTNA